ncbi:MAG: DUF1735 domain-containing protein [Bacteroidetes bacterium]|nr:DUF1735 domain-containing protein [Bacteroidota bacterium]
MKYISIKNILAVAAVVSLAGCLKKNEMNVDPDGASSIILFASTGNNQASTSSEFMRYYSDFGVVNVGDNGQFNINVMFSGGATAPSDITVNLALDTAALSTYNKEDGTSYVPPPAAATHFPTSLVIKKGTQLIQGVAKIDITSDFDFAKSYALPLKIVSSSYGVVSTNLGTTIYSFGVRNKFDGHYSWKGYSLRAGDGAKTGNFTNSKGLDLVTGGANSVNFGDLQVWADLTGVGIGNPTLTIAADNSVKISSSGGAYNDPAYTSRYDPGTKTFYVSFTWGSGPSSRLATDTLTYVNSR